MREENHVKTALKSKEIPVFTTQSQDELKKHILCHAPTQNAFNT